MDIFFQDPTEIPLPPSEVRVLELRAEPWPDGQRVYVYLEVTPFQKRPSAEVDIRDTHGNKLASISILETMVRKMEFTMHLHGSTGPGEFTINATLFYPHLPEEHSEDRQLLDPMVVDRAETTFRIEMPES